MSKSKTFHIARNGERAPDIGPLAGAVVAIGNFDGVHRGHRAVIGAALNRAKVLGRKAAALTFRRIRGCSCGRRTHCSSSPANATGCACWRRAGSTAPSS